MTRRSHRLGTDRPHAFHGSAIERTKPLKFCLDERTVTGFAGDSVLSALLASGIDMVGGLSGQPLALSERYAPSITMGQDTAAQALPMQRTPAIEGAEYFTVGTRPHLRLPAFGARRRSLRQDLDRSAIAEPWHDQPPHALITADVVIVGGGVAGMTAALAAARTGASVTLLESAPVLGGGARYFGSQEDDETPQESVHRLIAAMSANPDVTVILRAQVLAVHSGRLRAHRVLLDGAAVAGEVIDIAAPRIVLATGAIERLPVFPGNRLPRVMTSLEAYLLAERHGVWLGRSAILATVHSAAYRLPMLLTDAGIVTHRIADARTEPQSRFIEYSHAYGIVQATGTIPALAEPSAKGLGLSITLQSAFDGYAAHSDAPMPADLLLVCGGWQPDLTFWHMAGGRSRWSEDRHRLEALGTLPQIALAGSAAGYFSKHACLLSGQDAVDSLFGASRSAVLERSIDPIYETPDAATPHVQRADTTTQFSYLDAGLNLIQPPDPPAAGRTGWWPFHRPQPGWSLADQPRTLGLGDVAAGVQLGGIPKASAGIVAQERTVASGELIDAARLALLPDLRPAPAAPRIPAYLAARFGDDPQVWTDEPAEPQSLETGALIFVNSDQSDPRQAVGAIIGHEEARGLALIGKTSPQSGEGLTLRDQGRSIPIRLLEPLAEPRSGAALGSEAGPA